MDSPSSARRKAWLAGTPEVSSGGIELLVSAVFVLHHPPVVIVIVVDEYLAKGHTEGSQCVGCLASDEPAVNKLLSARKISACAIESGAQDFLTYVVCMN